MTQNLQWRKDQLKSIDCQSSDMQLESTSETFFYKQLNEETINFIKNRPHQIKTYNYKLQKHENALCAIEVNYKMLDVIVFYLRNWSYQQIQSSLKPKFSGPLFLAGKKIFVIKHNIGIKYELEDNLKHIKNFQKGKYFISNNWMECYLDGEQEKFHFAKNFPEIGEPNFISSARSIFIKDVEGSRKDGIFLIFDEQYSKSQNVVSKQYTVFIPFLPCSN